MNEKSSTIFRFGRACFMMMDDLWSMRRLLGLLKSCRVVARRVHLSMSGKDDGV